ncbi:hypothetical protein FB45DRAFT_1026668 [Roridomyces roridus]|uniref:Phosphatidylinositol N-acetylglucosaminyltransferase subunit H conserved domain-containing protein n=1 Tax=Roridomyces roridus TaxID=1738132 RepID=A0AAD7BWD7_9AGAR|nr:hypothetical protein FB45DRAFT_1026668 [Roridomyces roridus]
MNPEYVVLRRPGFTEFRVENWRLARDASGRVLMGVSGWHWSYSLIPLLVTLLWDHESMVPFAGFLLVLVVLAYWKCTQILFESVIVIPRHGIQLETHRGLPWFPAFTVKRRFIPLASLQDFVIHEGLKRWNVRYYLAAVQLSGSGEFKLHVAYENILPHFPVLLQIYRDVHAMLDK